MMKNTWIVVPAAAAMLLLAACNSSTPTQNPQSGQTAQSQPASSPETQLETGRAAFQRLYATARLWAADARPFREQSLLAKGADGHDGKAPVWAGGFASPARRTLKTFTWSGSHDPDAPSYGVSATVEDSYSPSNTSTMIFDIAFLKSDSDQAFAEAQKHGGAQLLKKNPKLPVYYLLDWQPNANALYWHVMYGSPDQPELRIAVDATKGTFVRVEH